MHRHRSIILDMACISPNLYPGGRAAAARPETMKKTIESFISTFLCIIIGYEELDPTLSPAALSIRFDLVSSAERLCLLFDWGKFRAVLKLISFDFIDLNRPTQGPRSDELVYLRTVR